MADDIELLRRFEPVVRYTLGEYFFPMAVDPYVGECDLWGQSPAGERSLLVPYGGLSLDALAEWRTKAPNRALFLRYVQEPLSNIELVRGERPDRPSFSAPGRLARVGVAARLIDAGFTLSLLLRGTVPGGTVAAAEVKYAHAREVDPTFYYYGRVVRQSGWTVCQYLYFYAMNDWRSSFVGANDHEADWEQCFVFLEASDDGDITPIWFVRAAHDEVGADLRRRWDDPLLQRHGNHPIIFAGAGSHAAYIEPGEYLQSVPLRLPAWALAILRNGRRFWVETLRQGSSSDATSAEQLAAVPFVDYARGDGVAIGPGSEHAWTPIVIDDTTPWVDEYEGLFGLDTRDRFAGERAPAGPKFNRDGRPRESWIDPVGFAGLQGMPPPGKQAQVLKQQIVDLRAERDSVLSQLADEEERAQWLGVRVEALKRAGRPQSTVATDEQARDQTANELSALRQRAEHLRLTISDIEAQLARLEAGDTGDPRAHLRFVAHPQSPDVIHRSRIVEVWSALGVAAAILLLGLSVMLGLGSPEGALLLMFFGFMGIEALVRRRFLVLLLNLTVVLAVVGVIVLIAEYPLQTVAILLLGIGFLLLQDNVQELRRFVAHNRA